MADEGEKPSAVEIANGYIAQGWAVVPPLGSVLRVQCEADTAPREFRVDEVELEVQLDLSLVMIDAGGSGEYADPEDIVEIVSVPEGYDDPRHWWRRPNLKE